MRRKIFRSPPGLGARVEPGISDWSAIVRVTATISAVIVLLLVLAYVIFYGKADFSSDDAVLSLQAESMWNQKTLFPRGWTYNNGDLLTPSGTFILAPLLSWFANSYELHAVASVFAIALMIVSLSFFLTSSGVSRPLIWIAIAVVASGLSRLSTIMMYLQTTYVWWPAGFFLGASAIWRYRSAKGADGPGKHRYSIGLALLVFALGFTNPSRALLMLVVPLYVFDRTLVGSGQTRARNFVRRAIDVCGAQDALVIGSFAVPFFLAGAICYTLLHTGVIHSEDFASNLLWEGWSSVWKHAQIFFHGWFDYLGGVNEFDSHGLLLERVLQPARTAFAIWLTWVGVAETLRIRRSQDSIRIALTAAFLAAFVPIAVIYLWFAPLAVNYGTTRYFSLAILILVAMAVIRVDRTEGALRKVVQWCCIPVCVVFVLSSAIRFIPSLTRPDTPLLATRTSAAIRLADTLVRENLEWGYATWWNAGAPTVLSRMKSRISPVVFDRGRISMFPVMRQSDWYSGDGSNGETFLALSHGEASAANRPFIDAMLGPPLQTVVSKDFVIFVYGRDIGPEIACKKGMPLNSRVGPAANLAHVQSVGKVHVANAGMRSGTARVVIRNDGNSAISGLGAFPVSIGFKLLDNNGEVINPDWLHWLLPCPVAPGEERVVLVDLPELPAGHWLAEVNLIQEGVTWFDAWNVKAVIATVANSPGYSIWTGNFDASDAR